MKIKEETILVDFSQFNRSRVVNHQSNFAYSFKVNDRNILNSSLAFLQQIVLNPEKVHPGFMIHEIWMPDPGSF